MLTKLIQAVIAHDQKHNKTQQNNNQPHIRGVILFLCVVRQTCKYKLNEPYCSSSGLPCNETPYKGNATSKQCNMTSIEGKNLSVTEPLLHPAKLVMQLSRLVSLQQ